MAIQHCIIINTFVVKENVTTFYVSRLAGSKAYLQNYEHPRISAARKKRFWHRFSWFCIVFSSFCIICIIFWPFASFFCYFSGHLWNTICGDIGTILGTILEVFSGSFWGSADVVIFATPPMQHHCFGVSKAPEFDSFSRSVFGTLLGGHFWRFLVDFWGSPGTHLEAKWTSFSRPNKKVQKSHAGCAGRTCPVPKRTHPYSPRAQGSHLH